MKPKKGLVIIHFQPLELYPPIQNLLVVLNESKSLNKITVISTCQNKVSDFSLDSNIISINRRDVASNTRVLRLLKYSYSLDNRNNQGIYFTAEASTQELISKRVN